MLIWLVRDHSCSEVLKASQVCIPRNVLTCCSLSIPGDFATTNYKYVPEIVSA